jgi:hypothetical protein
LRREDGKIIKSQEIIPWDLKMLVGGYDAADRMRFSDEVLCSTMYA